MADRTVNIAINYKVNTVEVQKAQAAAQAAQKATDDLRKSTQQYGPESARAFKQSTDAAKANHREIQGLEKGFSSLYNSVKLFLTAGVIREVIELNLNMAKLSGTVEGVEIAFKRLPGATLLLNDLRKATRGTVTDLELMQKSLMARNYQIPLEKLGTLLEFAAVKAQQTGQEVNHLVNYIVTGIGLRSTRRLDDLGFTANRVKEALNGATLQSVSMGEAMDAVFKLMKEDLEATGGMTETAATEVGVLERKWHDLRVVVAQKLENSGFIAFLQKAVDSVSILVKAFPTDKFKEIFNVWSINPIVMFRRMSDVIAHWHLNIDDVIQEQEIFNNALAETERVRKRLAELSANEQVGKLDVEIEKRQKIADAYFYQIQAANMTIDKYSDENIQRQLALKEIEKTIELLRQQRETVLASISTDEEQLGVIERKRKEIESLQEQIEKTTQLGDLGESGKLIEALKKAQKELSILLGDEIKLHEELGQLSDDEITKTKQVLQDKAEQRKRDLENEKENNKRSFEHWEYYQDIKVKKQREYEQEQFKIMEDNAARQAELQQAVLTLTEDFLQSMLDFGMEQGESETEAIREKYEEQIELAGDNERTKKELRIKQDREIEKIRQQEKEREKRAASTRIAIDGLVAIAKIFRDFGWPAGIAPAAIMAGITATNIATVKKYAKGKINIPGPGTETSDSIPAMLSKGESVITAQATRKSMGLLEAIQANKIDDRILKSIDFSVGNKSFNDSRMVEKLASLEAELKGIRKSQYKLEEQAGILYKVHEDGNGNKQRTRAKLGL